MQRFPAYLALAVAVTVQAVVLRRTGWRPGPVIDTAVFDVAVLAAGFMLLWGAEAAEKRIASALSSPSSRCDGAA